MKEYQQIDQYLATFRSHLGLLTLAQREEVLSEIGAHIRDAVAEIGDVSAVLARLGSPEDLAAEYGDGALVQRATETASPVLLLRAALRLATKGIFGVLVFLSGFCGYIFALTIALVGLIKPLRQPRQVSGCATERWPPAVPWCRYHPRLRTKSSAGGVFLSRLS